MNSAFKYMTFILLFIYNKEKVNYSITFMNFENLKSFTLNKNIDYSRKYFSSKYSNPLYTFEWGE